jgi:hypothetical protein
MPIELRDERSRQEPHLREQAPERDHKEDWQDDGKDDHGLKRRGRNDE